MPDEGGKFDLAYLLRLLRPEVRCGGRRVRASELRTLDRDVEAAYAEAPWRRPSIARSVIYDALEVAREHCRHYAADGVEPEELLQAPSITWREALWRIADLWIDECWPRLSGQPGGPSDHKMSGTGWRGIVPEPVPPIAIATRSATHLGGK